MKIAVLFNDPKDQVLQRRGPISREVYPQHNIDRIVTALEQNGHHVTALKADRYICDRLERFFGPLRGDEWPGLVFNLAFGIQGQLRYCHMPGLFEMLGLPYLGAGPLGHALASDKAAAKAIFRQQGLPTPEFALLHSPDFDDPDIGYPLVVKPVAEAASLGVRFVDDEQGLRAAVLENLDTFHTPVMAERFVSGREINVSVLGNEPGETLPPVEVVLGEGGLPIYTMEDKDGTADREFQLICPAALPVELEEQARYLALEAFAILNCKDWARVEFRLDKDNQLQILELNTIPGLGALSSLPAAAKQAGIADLGSLVQHLVDIAVQRYQNQPWQNTQGPLAVKR